MRACLLFFLVPLLLLGNYHIESYDLDRVREAWIELGLPISTEKKKGSQEEWVKWITQKENQTRLLQKIKSQIIEGGLDSSIKLSSMIASLESALVEWNETYASKGSSALGARGKAQWEYLACHIKKHIDEEINGNNKDERIQSLREEEKVHKDEAFELVLQATGEAIAAGGCAAGGMEIPAIFEGVQASRHLIKGCKEYNEGVRCQQEADALEKEYYQRGDESETKKWWELWK